MPAAGGAMMKRTHCMFYPTTWWSQPNRTPTPHPRHTLRHDTMATATALCAPSEISRYSPEYESGKVMCTPVCICINIVVLISPGGYDRLFFFIVDFFHPELLLQVPVAPTSGSALDANRKSPACFASRKCFVFTTNTKHSVFPPRFPLTTALMFDETPARPPLPLLLLLLRRQAEDSVLHLTTKHGALSFAAAAS